LFTRTSKPPSPTFASSTSFGGGAEAECRLDKPWILNFA
jgi:hypothetical protein